MRRTLPSFRGTRNTRGNFSNRQTLDFIYYNAYLVPIPVFSDDLENPNLHELRRDMETTLWLILEIGDLRKHRLNYLIS